jgi:hypothetical protein
MKRFSWLYMLIVLVISSSAAQALPTAWSPSMAGVGPHGYDWEIGNWSCTNSMPSTPMGGPSSETLTATRTNTGALLFRTTGANYDSVYYNRYDAKSKMWLSPFALADGSYGSESTTQTGKTTVWSGQVFFAPSRKTIPTRDTYVIISSTKLTDLGENQIGGSWKPQYNYSCTKT